MKKKVFIIDDHSMLRSGLQNYLEDSGKWEVTGSFSESEDCIKALEQAGLSSNKPELLIVDIQLKDESGFDLVKKLKEKNPETKIVMYSMYDTWGFILQAKELGVQGYISKVASDKELLKCLDVVASGGTYYEHKSDEVKNELDSILQILKKQEKVVLQLVLQGATNEQIKDKLFISLHTVENYVSYLLNVTSCKTRLELIEKFK